MRQLVKNLKQLDELVDRRQNRFYHFNKSTFSAAKWNCVLASAEVENLLTLKLTEQSRFYSKCKPMAESQSGILADSGIN